MSVVMWLLLLLLSLLSLSLTWISLRLVIFSVSENNKAISNSIFWKNYANRKSSRWINLKKIISCSIDAKCMNNEYAFSIPWTLIFYVGNRIRWTEIIKHWHIYRFRIFGNWREAHLTWINCTWECRLTIDLCSAIQICPLSVCRNVSNRLTDDLKPKRNKYIPSPFVNWMKRNVHKSLQYTPACDDEWPEFLWMSRFPLYYVTNKYTLKVIGKWAFYRRRKKRRQYSYIGHSKSIFVLWFRRDLNYKCNEKAHSSLFIGVNV